MSKHFCFSDKEERWFITLLEERFVNIYEDIIDINERLIDENKELSDQKYQLSLEKRKIEETLNFQIEELKAIIWEFEKITKKRIKAEIRECYNEYWDWGFDWFDFIIEDKIEEDKKIEKKEGFREDIPF